MCTRLCRRPSKRAEVGPLRVLKKFSKGHFHFSGLLLQEPEQISQMEASAQGFAKLNNWTVSQPPEWQTLQKLLEAF